MPDEMTKLIGALLPLLMGRADIGSAMRDIFGTGVNGAMGNDFLAQVSRMQASEAVNRFGLGPNINSLNMAADRMVVGMGMNATSQAGQIASTILRTMYSVMPDTFGGVLGVGNPQAMFQMALNGAGGIGMASGMGMASPLDPMSTLRSQERAMSLMREMYGFGMDNGRPRMSYTYGLSHGEQGLVAQRILSSESIYEGTYNDIAEGPSDELDKTSERLSNRLRAMGERVNRAASSLAKLTGSVDSALQLMDQLGGGNFLGGSAEQASEIARRAERISASIRVSSATAGISPMEAFKVANSISTGVSARMGIDPMTAERTGAVGAWAMPSVIGASAFADWSAMNLGATPQQRAQAELAIQTRAVRFAGSSTEAMSAIVARHADMFSDEQLSFLAEAMRNGRPNDALDMVANTIGRGNFFSLMKDPASLMAYRMRIASDPTSKAYKTYTDLYTAGMTGNVAESAYDAAQHRFGEVVGSMDLGDGAYDKLRRRKYRDLVAFANENGVAVDTSRYSEEDMDKLMSAMKEAGADVAAMERAIGYGQYREALDLADQQTMSGLEQSEARKALAGVLSGSGLSNADKLIEELNATKDGKSTVDGRTFNRILHAAKIGLNLSDADISAITKGKSYDITLARERLKEFGEFYDTEFSAEETAEAAKYAVGTMVDSNSFAKYGSISDTKEFIGRVMGDGMSADKMSGAMFDAFFKAVGGKIGNLSDEDLKGMKDRIGVTMLANLIKGDSKTLRDAARSSDMQAILGPDNAEALLDVNFDELDGAFRNGVMASISNVDREDLVKRLRELGPNGDIANDKIVQRIVGAEQAAILQKNFSQGLSEARISGAQGREYAGMGTRSASDSALAYSAAGKVVHFDAKGYRSDVSGALAAAESVGGGNLARSLMNLDSNGITKTIQGYIEEGRSRILDLQDSLGDGLSEFSDKELNVLAGGDADSEEYKSALAKLEGRMGGDKAKTAKALGTLAGLGEAGGLGVGVLRKSKDDIRKLSASEEGQAGLVSVAKAGQSGQFSELVGFLSKILAQLVKFNQNFPQTGGGMA